MVDADDISTALNTVYSDIKSITAEPSTDLEQDDLTRDGHVKLNSEGDEKGEDKEVTASERYQKMAKLPFIGRAEEADEFLVTNKYIKSGYRINYTTWQSILWSVFEVHNESMNVWTHLVGFIVCFITFIILCCFEVDEEIKEKTINGIRMATDAIQNSHVFNDLNWFQYQKNEFEAFMSELEYYFYQD